MSAVLYYASRCKVCRTPIRGIGSLPFRLRGIGPYAKNPQLCNRCSLASFPAEEREITVLFADVRGFTPFSEHAPLPALRASLNRLFGAASEILIEHEALVDKFIGDAVMALFNAPIPQPAHRATAVHAAVALGERALTLRLPFAIGIGLNSGSAIVGNVGAGNVTDFTAIGDTVNVAARLAGLALPGEILAARSTCIDAIDDLPPGYAVAETRVAVKGRAEPVDAYRITSASPRSPSA